MKKVIWVVVIVILVLVSVYLVQNKEDSDVIKIGVTESLTGNAAYYGESSKKGVDLGIKWIKNQYPNLNIEVYHEDNRFDPKVSVDAYNNLRNVHSVDIIVTQTSPATISIQPLAKRDNVFQMAISASTPNYTSPNDLSFRMTGDAKIEALPMVEYINNNFKNISILYMNNEIGLSASTALKEGLEKDNITEISSFEAFDVSDNDFKTEMLKIKNTKPDAIYLAGLASHILVALKEMKALNINSKLLTFRTGDDISLIKQGGNLVEGLVFTSNFLDSSNSPEVVFFIEQFKREYGEKPNSYAAEGYEAIRFLGKALDYCDKDVWCIKDYLTKVKDEPSVFGNISFNDDGDVFYSFFLKTIRNGEFVEVK